MPQFLPIIPASARSAICCRRPQAGPSGTRLLDGAGGLDLLTQHLPDLQRLRVRRRTHPAHLVAVLQVQHLRRSNFITAAPSAAMVAVFGVQSGHAVILTFYYPGAFSPSDGGGRCEP